PKPAGRRRTNATVPRAPVTATTSTKSSLGPRTAASTIAPYTTAVTVRRGRSLKLSAEAPLAVRVRVERLVEIVYREIGPQDFGRPHLRVGDLPKQEIGDAQLSSRADQEIGIGMLGSVEACGDGVPVPPVRGEAIADGLRPPDDALGA